MITYCDKIKRLKCYNINDVSNRTIFSSHVMIKFFIIYIAAFLNFPMFYMKLRSNAYS